MPGTLYLVPTPIGNLADISKRMADTLDQVDFIAAEDTRVSRKILNHLNLKKTMVSYHRHNTQEAGAAILQRLLDGQSCALVTDAGMPAISDPGEELVRLCTQNNVNVIPIPGPCALVCAIAAAGLPTARFTFEGFLPMNKKNRKNHLRSLLLEPRTMVFYEAPHKLQATLAELRDTFGPDRQVALCREISKIHEEIRRATLGDAALWYQENPPKGECVLVLQGLPTSQEIPHDQDDALTRVNYYRNLGLPLKDAAKRAAEETGISKNFLYNLAIGYK